MSDQITATSADRQPPDRQPPDGPQPPGGPPPEGPQPPDGTPPPRRAPLRPPSRIGAKTRLRLAGLVFAALLAALAAVSVGAYDKTFTPDTMVTLHTDSTGNEMNIDADVQVRGVVVGQVRSITADGNGARLTLAINPATARALPANVTAQMLPTTLFGERYVDLIEPPAPDADTRTLADTRTVNQDRSKDAVELETVLNDLLPMLTAVQPQKLSVTLTAIATTLSGRGKDLGQTLDTLDAYLKRLNPDLPALDDDIDQLVQLTRTYSQAAPGIIEALKDFTVTSKTIVAEASNLESLYSTVTGTSGTVTGFLDTNRDNLISLSAGSTATLRTLARYAPEFPCVFTQLTQFIPNMDRVLGAGTKQPGLHATITTVPAKAPYEPGRDTPRYDTDAGPHCYATPFTGKTKTLSTAGLGLPNSPQENELVNELASPSAGTPPANLPGWSSVLIGPLYRGTEVKVR